MGKCESAKKEEPKAHLDKRESQAPPFHRCIRLHPKATSSSVIRESGETRSSLGLVELLTSIRRSLSDVYSLRSIFTILFLGKYRFHIRSERPSSAGYRPHLCQAHCGSWNAPAKTRDHTVVVCTNDVDIYLFQSSVLDDSQPNTSRAFLRRRIADEDTLFLTSPGMVIV